MTEEKNANLIHLVTDESAREDFSLCGVRLHNAPIVDGKPTIDGFQLCEACTAAAPLGACMYVRPMCAGNEKHCPEEVGGICPACRAPLCWIHLHAPRMMHVCTFAGEALASEGCEDCRRGYVLSADGTNHIFGEKVGDVRACKFAGNFFDAFDAYEFAARLSKENREAFVIYENKLAPGELRYSVRRESLKLNLDLLGELGRKTWTIFRRVENQTMTIDEGTLSIEIESSEPVAPPTVSSPLTLELEETIPVPAPEDAATKKEQILRLYESEQVRDIAEIVKRVKARASYVAQVLQQAGHLQGYFDLYTTTGAEKNVYSRFFQNVLAFRNVEAARESIKKIDRLYNYFERLGDRAGQHQACVLALVGKNRARWSGKIEESEIFSEWLNSH